jgi:3',5'-cyclic AMP phosphodiesterase CpdA
MVLHTGDVIYMAGEHRLYDRNFRQPYTAFLTSESTVENLVFRLPFLPVPGNHDYYDLGGWASWLSRIPLVSQGLHAMAHRFLGFRLPEGGSDMGRAFMEAFLEPSPGHYSEIAAGAPLPYRCGERTRLPHRYYQFTQGGVDFFALDSNTLDAPPPAVAPESVRRAATKRSVLLEQELQTLESQLITTPTTPSDQLPRHPLSERILDIQRELALEQRRQRYEVTDFDRAQLEWLEAALRESQTERPDHWRVVFLHHPLYTSIHNHCERPDVRSLRSNLLRLLQTSGQVHLILSGHSHAFEWLRSSALPQTGIFVTGGGGQVALRSSVFASRYRDRSFKQRAALADAGIKECAVNGRGPTSPDGHAGLLYHYLRVIVRPDALRIVPVGVRLLHGNDEERRQFRREEPMPVYHIPEVPRTPTQRVPRRIRFLEYVEVRREGMPEAHWAEGIPRVRRGRGR